MAKHTPGPWVMRSQGYCNGMTGARGRHYWIEDADGKPIQFDTRSSDDAHGNAAICAAGPNLLKACKAAHAYAVAQAEMGRSLPNDLVADLYHAIAEAETP